MYIVAGGASASQTRAHIMSVIKKKGFKVDITDFSSQVGLLAIQGPARFVLKYPHYRNQHVLSQFLMKLK